MGTAMRGFIASVTIECDQQKGGELWNCAVRSNVRCCLLFCAGESLSED